MQLCTVTIRHFKSLADITVDGLSSTNVLVGTNAVGKSNFVDALKFLRDAVVDGLEHAISKRGGIALIRQYSPTRPYQIFFQLGMKQEFEGYGERLATYELALSSLAAGNYKVEFERCKWWEDVEVQDNGTKFVESEPFEKFFTRNSSGSIFDSDSPQAARRRFSDDSLVLGIGTIVSSYGLAIARFIAGFKFAAFYPNTLREPSRPDTDRALKENGENWASIIKSLKRSVRGRRAFDRVREMMAVVMPSLEDVTVKSVGGYLVPQFRVKSSARTKPHFFDPVQLSDGTLRVFGILLALNQVPPAPLLVIEEPEQTINPAVLGVLADAFREASDFTQIILTTHSPHFIDFFSSDQVRVVYMRQGKTLISRIKSTQVESVKEHLISLGDLMNAEGILPDGG